MADRICTVEDCDKPLGDSRYCHSHRMRVVRYGTPHHYPRVFTEERFWAKVDKTETCWIWTAGKDRHGYGQITAGELGKSGAHRVAWHLVNGPIPDGMQVDHKCHNRACVRPDHLQLATPRMNSENLAGARSHSRIGVRGVRRMASGRYQAHATHCGVEHSAGTFATIEEAGEAARQLRNRLMSNNLLDRAT